MHWGQGVHLTKGQPAQGITKLGHIGGRDTEGMGALGGWGHI